MCKKPIQWIKNIDFSCKKLANLGRHRQVPRPAADHHQDFRRALAGAVPKGKGSASGVQSHGGTPKSSQNPTILVLKPSGFRTPPFQEPPCGKVFGERPWLYIETYGDLGIILRPCGKVMTPVDSGDQWRSRTRNQRMYPPKTAIVRKVLIDHG